MLRVHTVLSGWPGGPGLQTFYFLGTGEEVQSDADDVVSRVRAFWTLMQQRLCTKMTVLVNGDVDVLNPSSGTVTNMLTSTATPTPILGSGSATFNAYPAMLLLRSRTAGVRKGQRVSGRSFIGPMGSDTDIDGVPGPGTLSELVAAADALKTGPTDEVPVVWSRNTGGVISDGQAFPVVAYSASPKWAILTSRRD